MTWEIVTKALLVELVTISTSKPWFGLIGELEALFENHPEVECRTER
jgi:hypothetical protein